LALGLKIGAHGLRATAATNALDHDADIAKVQEWLGHSNIATTRIYDRRTLVRLHDCAHSLDPKLEQPASYEAD